MTARTAFLVLVGGFTLTLAYAWSAFPERVPVHFGASGEADRVVSRERAVLEAGVTGYGTAALLAGTAALVRRAPLSMINAPHKELWSTPENEPRLRAMAARDVWAVGAMTMALLAAAELHTVAVADDPQPRLGAPAVAGLVAYLLAVVGYLVRAFRGYRHPGEQR